MLTEIEAGRVGTVIVKDMSRFGRNYLQVGFYMEMMFPKKNVRFIAVNNGVDSANPADNDFTPFLNIMNEWYAKDTSKKIKAVFKAKIRDGKRVSGAVPYGYYRKPEDKQTLYVDEVSASVVRRIFQFACDGMGATAIADTLSEDKILIPSAYARQNHPEDCQCTNYHDPYTWNATTVGYILNRREYLGHTVLGKTTRDNFKTKRKRIANEDELLVFYNTHEAIIDQETYDKAQRMRKRVSPRRNSEKPAHRLSGLLYCADCGSRLAYINSKPKDGKLYDSNQAFRCSRYHNKYHSCTGHYIKASTIEMLIYQATKRVSQYVLKDEKEFVEQLKAQYELQCEKDNTDDKKELLEAKRRMMDLDNLIKGLYENFTLGRLPERQFNRLMTEYDTEQSNLEQRISELETATERISTKAVQIDKFVRLVKKYRDFEELTTPMLNDFIEKVVIHEAEGGRTKDRTQQVDIYFNFIGNFVLPLSEDEVEALQSEEARRAEEIAERKRKSSKKSTQKRNQKRVEIKAKTEDLTNALYKFSEKMYAAAQAAGAGAQGFDGAEQAPQEDGVFDAVSLGVEFGALDRGGDDVDAHGLRAGAGGKERHRAHAAVEVEQDLVLFGRNPLKRHGVEPLRLSRIGLQEGFGTHRKAQPPDRRFDAVRARNVQAVASEHRIAGRRVQVEEDARDAFLHELLRKLPDKDPDFGRLAVHAEREEALRLL